MFKLPFNPLQLVNFKTSAGADGYFGWTDRYGVRRAQSADEQPRRKAHQKPYFIANY